MTTHLLSSRMRDLVRATAAGLREGEPPLGHRFLVEHDVTMDEAYDLAEWLAAACDALLELEQTKPGQRLVGVALGAAALAKGDGS